MAVSFFVQPLHKGTTFAVFSLLLKGTSFLFAQVKFSRQSFHVFSLLNVLFKCKKTGSKSKQSKRHSIKISLLSLSLPVSSSPPFNPRVTIVFITSWVSFSGTFNQVYIWKGSFISVGARIHHLCSLVAECPFIPSYLQDNFCRGHFFWGGEWKIETDIFPGRRGSHSHQGSSRAQSFPHLPGPLSLLEEDTASYSMSPPGDPALDLLRAP